MDKKQEFLGKRLDQLLDFERIEREGATLKNVSDNMRSITVCIAMLVGVGLMSKTPFWAASVVAALWGVWTLWYAALACLQAGMLFVLCLKRALPAGVFKWSSKLVSDGVAYLFAMLAMTFMYGAVFLIATSITHMSSKT